MVMFRGIGHAVSPSEKNPFYLRLSGRGRRIADSLSGAHGKQNACGMTGDITSLFSDRLNTFRSF
jgi:hypothetical protein